MQLLHVFIDTYVAGICCTYSFVFQVLLVWYLTTVLLVRSLSHGGVFELLDT